MAMCRLCGRAVAAFLSAPCPLCPPPCPPRQLLTPTCCPLWPPASPPPARPRSVPLAPPTSYGTWLQSPVWGQPLSCCRRACWWTACTAALRWLLHPSQPLLWLARTPTRADTTISPCMEMTSVGHHPAPVTPTTLWTACFPLTNQWTALRRGMTSMVFWRACVPCHHTRTTPPPAAHSRLLQQLRRLGVTLSYRRRWVWSGHSWHSSEHISLPSSWSGSRAVHAQGWEISASLTRSALH